MAKSSNKSRPGRPQSSGRSATLSSATAEQQKWPWAWGAAALVALAIFAVYGRSLDAPFIFDDYNSVETNETIRSLWPLVGDAANPGPLYTPKFAPTSSRPVVNLSLALSYQLGGLDPRGYRLFNIVLHALSAMLLLGIVRRTLRLRYFSGRFDAAADWLALAASLVWALHPLQTESVAYITQRTELMMGFFYLATLYCSLRYWTTTLDQAAVPAAAASDGGPLLPGVVNNDRAGWLLLASLACLAGMGSKEVMVSAPLIVLLFARTFVAGSLRQALLQSWPLFMGLACGWLLLAWLNYNSPHSDSAGFHLGIPAYVWWLTQAKVLLMYLKLVVWPWPLVIHYELPYLESFREAWMYVLPVAFLGVATLVLLWRNHPLGFMGTFVFAILSPTLVIPVVTEMAAERRMYLPLASISVLAVVGGYLVAQAGLRRYARGAREPTWATIFSSRLVIAYALAVTLLFAVVSQRRLASYDSEMTLWQEVLQRQPHNYVAHDNVGSEYFRAGNMEAAGNHFREAIRWKPDCSLAHYNLALVLTKTGRFDEATTHFGEAVKYRPGSPELLNNLGVSLYAAGRYSEAIPIFEQAIQLKPSLWRAYDNLGNALARTGCWTKAIENFGRALKLEPKALDVYSHLADAQAHAQRPSEAVATVERALKLARAAGADAMAAKIETQLAAYRASLSKSENADIRPSFGSAMPSN